MAGVVRPAALSHALHSSFSSPATADAGARLARVSPQELYYEQLPPTLLRQLSPPPSGYQYVRVANDVLMMAIATRLIAGAVA